jgi:hypothetical protein
VALLKKSPSGNNIAFVRGKHQGESLEKVAEADPGYLRWLYKNASEDLPQDVFHKLQDVMEERGIKFP